MAVKNRLLQTLIWNKEANEIKHAMIIKNETVP